MSITRVEPTDDDGTGTTGTVFNKAWIDLIHDMIDGRWSEASTTSTGNQDNLSYSEADVLRCNNATALTLRGILAPASPLKPGKRLIVASVGAGAVTINHQDTNSTAANRVITSDGNPIVLAAGTGVASLEYDSTTARWRVSAQSSDSASTTLTVSSTSTGTQNDFTPGIAAATGRVTVLRCNNATLLTITGFAAGIDGQRLILESVGAGQVDLSHQAAGSTAANRLINFATVGTTSLAAGSGTAEYVYDGTTLRWRLVRHEQGAWILRTFAAGNYTTNGAGGVTVDSGDVVQDAYYLKGRTLNFAVYVVTFTVTAATGAEFRVTLPASLASNRRIAGLASISDNGTNRTGIWDAQAAGVLYVRFFADQTAALNWTASTNNSTVFASMTFEVQ